MQQLNDIINFFKNISEEQIVNLLTAIIIIVIFCALSSVLSYIVIKLFMRKEHDKEKIKANGFYLPLKILFITIGFSIGLHIMQMPDNIMKTWNKIYRVIIICIIAKGLVNIVDPKSELAQKFRKKDISNKDKTVANFTGRILKYVIYIFAGFCILGELEYDISGLVAGLGIGGAIAALAAQDFVKSLLAGFIILSDKPFLVGDWIEVGENQGTVVDISFRCTKIKTVDETIVTLQNSVLISNSIINWSRMNRRRYCLNIKLPLETNADTAKTIVNRIKFVLQTVESVIPDTIQVHFDAIDQQGINIMIYLYTTKTAYDQFLGFKQDVNESILKILESENIKLAYPGQNIYLLDTKKT